MTLLIVLALLIALDLLAWRWATTPATTRTGRPEHSVGNAGEKGGPMLAGLARFAVRRGRLALAGTLAAVVVVGVLVGGFSYPTPNPTAVRPVRGDLRRRRPRPAGAPQHQGWLGRRPCHGGYRLTASLPKRPEQDHPHRDRPATSHMGQPAGGRDRPLGPEDHRAGPEALHRRLEADSAETPSAATDRKATMRPPPEPLSTTRRPRVAEGASDEPVALACFVLAVVAPVA
jgi:hypothetical protein